MKTSEKKKRANRSYYEKNRERILNQRRFSRSNLVSLVQPSSATGQIIDSIRQSRLGFLNFISLEAALLFLIVSVTTVFLFQESIRFYTQQDAHGGASALLKALTCEGVLLGLSWAKIEGKMGRLFQGLLTGCVVILFVVTTCGALFSNVLKQKAAAERYRSDLVSLQVQIEGKEKLYQELLLRDRLSSSRVLGRELDQLRENYRAQLQAAPDSSQREEGVLALMNAAALALFRIVALCANCLFIRRLRVCVDHPKSSFRRIEKPGFMPA